MSQVIPLVGGVDNAFQQFDIQLGENVVRIKLAYVTSIDAWAMDIEQDNQPLMAGAMLRASADILEAWHCREWFGAMTIAGQEPTLDNLGDGSLLVWSAPDEL